MINAYSLLKQGKPLNNYKQGNNRRAEEVSQSLFSEFFSFISFSDPVGTVPTVSKSTVPTGT